MLSQKKFFLFLHAISICLVLEFQNRNESPFCLLFVCHLFETVSMLPIHNLHMILSCKIIDMIFAEASVGSLLMKTVGYLLVKFS